MASIIAAKGGEKASKALTGDIYVRKWTSVRGTGRNKRIVEHEARVNPVGIGVGALALGAAALAVGGTLWAMQLRPTIDAKHMGRWKWPSDGAWASKEQLYPLALPAPTRTIYVTRYWQVIHGTPVLIDKTTYDELQGTGAVTYTTQVPVVETANAVDLGDKYTTGLERRPGFLEGFGMTGGVVEKAQGFIPFAPFGVAGLGVKALLDKLGIK